MAGTLLLLGVTTTAFLTTIDSRQPSGLYDPLLLVAALATTKGRWSVFAVVVGLAALLKPQLVVLLVLPLIKRRYRDAVLGGAIAIAGTVMGFLCFPTYFPANLVAWFGALVRRTGDYQPGYGSGSEPGWTRTASGCRRSVRGWIGCCWVPPCWR